ncbi:MAG: hypothetical protein N5P05_004445 (plasmid) [Chroococcopsis gigantea SAG 12.99]|jgi:hypothetical protein|nr:hypothetical protein [Chlorogloea purpurea SAG 13.99]MDV3002790.1 hypothetical protein [Chroococcopsis gigantea SAG 12.99]
MGEKNQLQSTPSNNDIASVIWCALSFKEEKGGYDRGCGFQWIRSDVDRLFKELEKCGISYLLVGGMAMLTYVDGRNVENIDLIVDRSDLTRLAGMVIVSENGDYIRADYGCLELNLWLTRNAVFEEVRQNYRTERWCGNRCLPCASPSGLVIRPFYALPSLYREGSFALAALYETDILQLVYYYNICLESEIDIVEVHMNNADVSGIRSVAGAIEQRRI